MKCNLLDNNALAARLRECPIFCAVHNDMINIFWDNFQGFPGPQSWNPVKGFVPPPNLPCQTLVVVISPMHPHALTHLSSLPLLTAGILILFPHHASPPPALYPPLCLCSLPVKFWCLGFWCPAHLDLFVISIYFSLSPWCSYLSFPFIEAFFPSSILKGWGFLRACGGFFVWSAVFGVSFDGTGKWYLNLTYPPWAAHEEHSSELYTCLTPAWISALYIYIYV